MTTVYALGVIAGLLCVDGSMPTKVGLAIVWPLGLLAFIITIAALVGVAAIAFPMFGIALVGVLAAAWYFI